MLYKPIVTSIFTVPDLCGVPPSTAINFKDKFGRSSLSKGFWTYLLPSGLTCCFKAKLSIVSTL
uniref:Uncharacterized protein n=1 Tax=Seriola dumerili TaxID=41447 RepID=A0A3B4VQZ0_SERDU